MSINTKTKGNKAEAVVLSEFIKHNIPVLLPFGDNEKYDLVVQLGNEFKSVQVKYGRSENGCIVADIRHKIGVKRISYGTYYDKVDFIAIWSEFYNKTYLIDLKAFGDKTQAKLRIDNPKNNSSISTVCLASDYELSNVLKNIL